MLRWIGTALLIGVIAVQLVRPWFIDIRPEPVLQRVGRYALALGFAGSLGYLWVDTPMARGAFLLGDILVILGAFILTAAAWKRRHAAAGK